MIVLITKTKRGYHDTLKKTMLFKKSQSYEVPEALGTTLVKSGAAVYSAEVRDTLHYFQDTRKNVDGYRQLTDLEWTARQ